MSDARGIHAHPTLKLGLKPGDPSKPRLRAAQFLDVAAALSYDPQDDNLGALPFGLYKNDQYGDCGPTSVANNLIQVTQGKTVPMVTDVLDLYRRSGNPGFPRDDNGVVMQDMLDELLKNGIGGRKPVAFAAVDKSNLDELDAAINVFDGVLLGVTLRVAQQNQTDRHLWDFVAGSGMWGGHAVLGGRYVSATRRNGVVTWAEIVDFTDAFRVHQLDEVWVVVWPEHLTRPGVDVLKLAAAFKALTGQNLPAPIVPGGDVPEPSGCFLVGPFSDRRQGALARHAKAHGFASVDAYLTSRLEHGSY